MTQTASQRYDGDTWDLASSVGATATSVAASRALASNQPSPLIHDPFADPLVKAVGMAPFIRVANGEANIEDDPLLARRRMCEQIAVRTRYYDDFLTDAADSGVRQMVILASGLDTRAYRLRWPSGTVVFEIDQPQVIEFKTRVLADLDAAPTGEHHPVGVDLRDDWPQALLEHGFSRDAPSAWIAEGLLVYLPSEAQDRLLDNITALSAPGSMLATEYMADTANLPDDWARRLTEHSKRIGSNIDLSALTYSGERTSVIDHLTEAGWRVSPRNSKDAYAANGFELPDDDLMAMFGDSGYLSATLA